MKKNKCNNFTFKKMKLKFFINFHLNFCFCTLMMMMLRLACASSIELFKGEISLRQYLQRNLCGVKSFVLIENFQFENKISAVPNNSERPKINRVLVQISNCVYRRFDNINMSQLNEQLPTTFFYFRTLQLIFDLSNFRIANRSTLAQMLQAFGQIYDHCSPCTPFLVLFDHSLGPQRLFEWSMFAQSLVSSTFQSALIADLDSTMVTVLWRPVLDGCRSTEPIFWPRSVADFARLNVHFCKCNLGSVTLNVSNYPICSITRDLANNRLLTDYSIEIEFLKLLAANYNFKYQLIDGKQVWGMLVPENGTWNGVIGHVINGISHMALCGITRTQSRYTVIDFTRRTLNIAISFVSHRPKRLNAARSIVSTLFTATWYGLVAAFVLLTLMLYAAMRQSHSYGRVLQMFYEIAMRQSGNKLISLLRTDSTRLLCAAWLFTIVIVYNFYGSIFFSLLTVLQYEPAIDTLDDLVREANADRYQIVVPHASATQQRFLHAEPDNPVLYAIGRHLNRTTPNSIFKSYDGLVEFVAKNSKRIGILGRFMLSKKRNDTDDVSKLHIGSEDILQATTGMVLPKRSPLLYPFNHVIAKLHEFGIFHYWLTHAGASDVYGTKRNRANFQPIKAISVQDIDWLFKLFMYIYLICATVLLIEICVRRLGGDVT